MTQTYLSDYVRRAIKQKLVEASFSKDEKALKKRENALAKEVIDTYYGKRVIDYLRKAPEALVNRQHLVKVRTGAGHQKVTELGFAKPDVGPSGYGTILVLDAFPTLDAKVRAFIDDEATFTTRKEFALNHFSGIASSVRTVEKLIQVWPEIAPYCPDSEQRAMALVVKPEIVNALFGLPVGKRAPA